MTKRVIIPMPQFTVNDDAAVIIEWYKKKGDMVTKGEIICVAETTKASFEIETDHDGYFFPLAEVSTKVKIGNPLAVVTLLEKDSLKSIKKWLLKTVQKTNINQSKKNKTYTKKAMILANRLGFDINSVSAIGGKSAYGYLSILARSVQFFGKHTQSSVYADSNSRHDSIEKLGSIFTICGNFFGGYLPDGNSISGVPTITVGFAFQKCPFADKGACYHGANMA